MCCRQIAGFAALLREKRLEAANSLRNFAISLTGRPAAGHEGRKRETHKKISIMIIYKVIKKKNPADATKQKFYPMPVCSGHLDLDEVALRISCACTVSVHDVKGVLAAVEEHVATSLCEGRSVRLPNLGSFHVRVNSKKGGKTAADDVKTDDVERLRIHFSKSSKLLRTFNRANSSLKFKKQDGTV